MIALLSPAKSLNFTPVKIGKTTEIRLANKTKQLVNVLCKKNSNELKKLMKVSDKIADLNVARYQNFDDYYTKENAKASIYAFNGDVYTGFDVNSLSNDDIHFAQSHIRILSGLYGLLRPLDLIQPYRLEMGTKLKVGKYNTLYDFWSDKISTLTLEDLKLSHSDTVVNLASNEYFKSVKPYLNNLQKKNKIKIVDVQFLDNSKGTFKIISFYAKKARGMMANFICKNKVTDPKQLITFDYQGYHYDSVSSDDNKLVFRRLQQ